MARFGEDGKKLNEKVAVFGAFFVGMKAAIPWTLSNNITKTTKTFKENSRYLRSNPDQKYKICRVFKIRERDGRYQKLITRWVEQKRLWRHSRRCPLCGRFDAP